MSDQLALLKERGMLVDNEQAALEDFGANEGWEQWLLKGQK